MRKLIDDRVKEAVARGAQSTRREVRWTDLLSNDSDNVPLDAVIANEETFGPVVVVEVVTRRRRDCRRKSHNVRPHVFDSRREYLQGIRDGAEGSRRNRQCKNSPTVNDEIHAPMGGVRDSGWAGRDPAAWMTSAT